MHMKGLMLSILSIFMLYLLVFSTKTYHAYSNETATLPATYYTSKFVNDQGVFTAYIIQLYDTMQINNKDYSFSPRYITISGKKYTFSTIHDSNISYGVVTYTDRNLPHTITIDGFTLSYKTYSNVLINVPKMICKSQYVITVTLLIATIVMGIIASLTKKEKNRILFLFTTAITFMWSIIFFIFVYIQYTFFL